MLPLRQSELVYILILGESLDCNCLLVFNEESNFSEL